MANFRNAFFSVHNNAGGGPWVDPNLVLLNTHLSNYAECPSGSRNMYACLTRKDKAAAFSREQPGLFSFSQILIILLTQILRGDTDFVQIENHFVLNYPLLVNTV